MAAWRGRARSGEEPVAFRRVPAGEPTTVGSDWELALGPRSSDAPTRSSRYNSAALARDLSGATAPDFNCTNFVRRLLAELNDRPTAAPRVMDGSLDADAALAALDAVEFMLQRRRDLAVRDEAGARDALRQELHGALRQRDEVTRAADAVAEALPGARARASGAAGALDKAVAPLAKLVARRARLATARDTVRLLDGGGLNIVRASEILALLRKEERKGTIARVLDEEDAERAKGELRRCEDELAARLDGVGMLRECAMAAHNLEREDDFIGRVVERQPVFALVAPIVSRTALERGDDAGAAELVGVLAGVRWECASALRNFVAVAMASFPNPVLALGAFVGRLVGDRLLGTATHVLVSIRGYETEVGRRAAEMRIAMENEMEDSDRMVRKCEEADDVCLAVGRRVVYCTTGIVKTLTSAVHELIELCLNAETRPVNKFGKDGKVADAVSNGAAMRHFSGSFAELRQFVQRQQRGYAVLEKQWVERKVAKVFVQIAAIDTYASQLNHVVVSDADAFNRYRARFSKTASHFVDMTKRSIASSLESLQRASTMVMLALQVDSLLKAGDVESTTHASEVDTESAAGESNERATSNQDTEVAIYEQDELKTLISSIAHGLVQTYLTNSETLLQAASHLLPNSRNAANQYEVWSSGSSPMSSYVEAIGALSKADAYMHRFLSDVVLDDVTIEPLSLAPVENDVLTSIQVRIRTEARHELIRGLKRLALDTRLGVEAAASAAGVQVAAMLATPGALDAYTDVARAPPRGGIGRGLHRVSRSGLETEPTMPFVTASLFVERQLQASRIALCRNNAEYVGVVLAERVRDVVIQHWAVCRGPFSKLGALLLMVNARAMVRAFATSAKGAAVISVLSVLAQLHFDSGDEIWAALEGGGLARLGASTILKVLEKRQDLEERTVRKIKDVLLVSETEDQDNGEDEERSVPWDVSTSDG